MSDQFVVTFPRALLSWNTLVRMNHKEYARVRKEQAAIWGAEVLAVLSNTATLDGPVSIEVTGFGPNKRDPDNLFVKPLIDALRKCVVILDDSCDVVDSVTLRFRVGKPTRTLIAVRSIGEEASS